jgi:hypothetical protein
VRKRAYPIGKNEKSGKDKEQNNSDHPQDKDGKDKKKEADGKSGSSSSSSSSSDGGEDAISKGLDKAMKLEYEFFKKQMKSWQKDPLTLSHILNILDGLLECHGRILVRKKKDHSDFIQFSVLASKFTWEAFFCSFMEI